MSKVYSQAPSGVAERVAHLIKVFHKDLQDAGVKIDLLSIADDDPEVEHALKLRGYPCYAIVRAVEVKGRTMGRGDAEIVIDEAKYLTMSDATKDAILDHEIQHIELQLNPKTGRVKKDCCGRPKIKMQLHDVEYGHFIAIAMRHGAASIECQQAAHMFLTHRQTLFAFIDENQPALEAAPVSSDVDQIGRRFVKNISRGMKEGESVTISSPGHRGVTIDKDGVRAGKAP